MHTIFKALAKRAIHFPEQKALISNNGHTKTIITNQQLLYHISTIGSFFKQEKVQCIGLFMDNCAQWIMCDLAAAKLGITLVPIPLFFTATQVEHLISSSGVEVIITQPLMSGILQGNPLLTIENSNIPLPIENTVMLRVKLSKAVDLANSLKVTYTSGSTGDPKGVCLSAENIGAVCDGLHLAMSSMAITNHLCVLPLATLLENIAGVYVCLLHGGAVITEPLMALGFLSNAEFNIYKLLEKIELYQAGSIILLPQMLTLLVHSFNDKVLNQCASLQCIAVGGGKSSTAILQQANLQGLPVFEGYGLSECGSVVSLNLPNQQKIGSVGKALPHVSVCIAEDGEIIIENQAMLGYLGELEQPLECINTGDLGHIDEDGYIFVTGRKSNIIVSSFGRNISPEWVEANLSSSAVIAQIAVFGEARPSLSAVIFSLSNSIIEINTAIDECNKFLPDYAQIRQWVKAVEPFTPNNNLLTNNGRLKRLNIEQDYQTQLAALYS